MAKISSHDETKDFPKRIAIMKSSHSKKRDRHACIPSASLEWMVKATVVINRNCQQKHALLVRGITGMLDEKDLVG